MPNPETDIVQSRIGVPGPNGGTVTAGDFSGVLNRLAALEAIALPPQTAIVSGLYYGPLSIITGWGSLVATQMVANRLYGVPVAIAQNAAFNQIGVEVTTAATGATIQVGLYTIGADGLPTQLVQALGTIDASATGWRPVTIAITIARGNYWIGFASNATININAPLTVAGMPALLGQASTSGTSPRSALYQTALLTAGFGSLPTTFGPITTWPYVYAVWIRAT